MKKKIDMSEPPVNLAGQPIGSVSLARICAEDVIAKSARTENVLKLFGIAQELYRNGDVVLDLEDIKLVRDVVEQCSHLALFAKAQMLQAIDSAETMPEVKSP